MKLHNLIMILVLAAVVTACSDAEDDFPGSEYMPDMAHSVAMEANTYNYYYYNTWDDRSTVKLGELAYPKYTVEGTVPRGYAGQYIPGMQPPATIGDAESMLGGLMPTDSPNAMSIPTNGHVPYYYDDTPEGREAAIADNMTNPFPITETGLVRGANLYSIFCGICHGEAGDGLGYIYDTDKNPQAKYPAAPASFLRPEFLEASNGRYYHAIMYGYNVMGGYADKMNYEERWQVIHYIRSLQAKETETEYNQEFNTFNPSVATPLVDFDPLAARQAAPSGEEGGEELMSDAAVGGDAQPTLRKK